MYDGINNHISLFSTLANLIRRKIFTFDEFRSISLNSSLEKEFQKIKRNNVSILNEFYKSKCFRKLHIEEACFGGSLNILHSVFFPYPIFDIPILGIDLVATKEGISAAILDLSPVGDELPPYIENKLSQIDFPKFKKLRDLPIWGDIFSNYVCFIKPTDTIEEQSFVFLVEKYIDILSLYCADLNPEPEDAPSTLERHRRQFQYCLKQKQNDKTKDVLSKTFNNLWACNYLDQVLFECPPIN